MKEIVQEIIGWGYPLISLVVIIIAARCRVFPGKPWLLAYLVIGLVSGLAWRIPRLLLKFNTPDFNIARFFDVFALPLNITGLVGYCMLIPFVLAVTSPSHLRSPEALGVAKPSDGIRTLDISNPLYGVHGWLKFLVVVNMYFAPVLFGIQQIMGIIGIFMLAEKYPGIVVVGLIETAAGIFLVVKWIMIARRLRDIVPGVVQETKKWLLITLAWNILSTPMVFMSGMDAKDVVAGAIQQLFGGIISFTIWYTYFNVSKRVKATYSDWSG